MFFWLWTVYLFLFTGHVAYIDIRTRCIPNKIVGGYGSGMLVFVGCAPGFQEHWLSTALATLLVIICGIFVYMVCAAYIGAGDIKYTMVLSLALGGSGTLHMLVIASWLALVALGLRRLIWRISVRESLAFAPYISLSTLLVWLWPMVQS